jgi:Tfp pilus assembly protein PilW
MKKPSSKRFCFVSLKSQRGFTMAELLVSAGMSLMVLAGVYTVFRGQTHTVKVQEQHMEAHEYALNAIDMMVREIRNTGYFPTGSACANVANTAGVVATPTATSFRFVFDANGDGTCEEDITYAYTGTDITRTANGTTVTLTDANVTAFQLTYYPQQTSGTAPSPFCISTNVPSGCSGTLDLAKIQKILISITVQSQSNDSQFNGQSSVTMSLHADLRNHGLSS